MVIISTSRLNHFNFSFAATPKRCSSSMMTNPNFLNTTSSERSRCVPIRISISPRAVAASVSACSFFERNRQTISMRTGKAAIRSVKLSRCCWASTVVGTRIATCSPSSTALNAHRMATSVLPKPTSPQSKRSIGRAFSISRLSSSEAVS